MSWRWGPSALEISFYEYLVEEFAQAAYMVAAMEGGSAVECLEAYDETYSDFVMTDTINRFDLGLEDVLEAQRIYDPSIDGSIEEVFRTDPETTNQITTDAVVPPPPDLCLRTASSSPPPLRATSTL